MGLENLEPLIILVLWLVWILKAWFSSQILDFSLKNYISKIMVSTWFLDFLPKKKKKNCIFKTLFSFWFLDFPLKRHFFKALAKILLWFSSISHWEIIFYPQKLHWRSRSWRMSTFVWSINSKLINRWIISFTKDRRDPNNG